MKKPFEPKLEKKYSKVIDRYYWLSDREMGPHEGLPVYSFREMKELNKLKDKLTAKDYLNIWEIKLSTGSLLCEIMFAKKKKDDIDDKNRLSEVAKEALRDIKNKLNRGKNEHNN